LYSIFQSHVFINEELVKNGYAKWIDEAEYYIPQELPDDIHELTEAFDAAIVTDEVSSSEETDLSCGRSVDATSVDIESPLSKAKTNGASDININSAVIETQ
jgi:hypothetical protein